jgi:hypothetical protein
MKLFLIAMSKGFERARLQPCRKPAPQKSWALAPEGWFTIAITIARRPKRQESGLEFGKAEAVPFQNNNRMDLRVHAIALR